MILSIVLFIVTMVGAAGGAFCVVDSEYGHAHPFPSALFAVMRWGGSLLCAATFILYLLGIL